MTLRTPYETEQALNTINDLRTAAAAVSQRGWAQGTLADERGRLCALGALNVALYGVPFVSTQTGSATGHWLLDMRIRRAADAIQPLLPEGVESCDSPYLDKRDQALNQLVNYNDVYCRGGDELVELFTQSAEKLEADL